MSLSNVLRRLSGRGAFSPETRVRATWNGEIIAESDQTIVIEGNHYFPAEAVRHELLAESSRTSVCPWKGTAGYYDVIAGGRSNASAAWYYPAPKPAAAEIKDRIAFWKGVRVEPVESDR